MSRIKLPKGKQKDFLNSIGNYFNFNWRRVAKICGISKDTLKDWRREKYKMSYEALLKLNSTYDIAMPYDLIILPEYWSAKKYSRIGALKRNSIYGNPGTKEGRQKGGVNSQRIFRSNPEYARKIGVKILKNCNEPKHCVELAEFIGIMLGDGGMNDYQINLTYNRETDADYGEYIKKLFEKLFSISATTITKSTDKANRIIASSKKVVTFLRKNGLEKGNKVKNKVRIPQWILRRKSYCVACLRGLFDTDGSFYSYKQNILNKKYLNFAVCFTNHSKPLLKNVYNILKMLSFNPIIGSARVYLYRKEEIERYIKYVGTHNNKHLQKYSLFISVRGYRIQNLITELGRKRSI